MDIIARLEHVTKRYGPAVALDRVSVSVPGGVTGVLGPNGAGKSTMIDILSGLRRPTTGRVEVLGGDPASRPVRVRLGLTPQATALPWRLTVIETLDLLAAHYPRPLSRDALVDDLDLGGFRHRRNGVLSGGQRRRVALAAALIGRPSLLLLDEPTTGLDADSRNRMWSAITGFAGGGAAVVLSTHDMAEAEHLTHQVVVLAGGQVRRTGEVREVCAAVGLHLVEVAMTGPLPRLPVTGPADRVEARGNRLHIYAADPDAVVRTLVRSDAPFHGLRVERVGLAEAIRAITEAVTDPSADPSSRTPESRTPERVA